MRDIAFIDIETTGLEADYHEIVEIAALRADPSTLDIKGEMNARIHPEHPERCDPEAMQVNRYSAEHWKDAWDLRESLSKLTRVINGCILAGHNVHFDWSFLLAAYRRLEVVQPDVDYHLLDTASFAWPLVIAGVIDKPTLRSLCDLLGVSNDGAHTARGDALRAMGVYRRIASPAGSAPLAQWIGLQADERTIVNTIVARLHEGRGEYGPWRIGEDGRRYPREAFYEVIDALNYCAAQLVRLGEQEMRS